MAGSHGCELARPKWRILFTFGSVLCTSGRGGAYRLFEEPKRDPGIHSGRGGATAGGLARLQPAAALAYFPRSYRK